MTYDIVFVVASVVAIAAALMVVLSPNPFISALSLIANLIALATLYLLLQSDFLAAAQVIVYAGAVMIMFLFVTAYLGGRADEPTGDRPVWQTLAALIAAAAIVAEIVFGVGRQDFLHGAGRERRVRRAPGDRRHLPRPLPAGLRGHLGAAAGRRDRRRRPGDQEAGDARGRTSRACSRSTGPSACRPCSRPVMEAETHFDVVTAAARRDWRRRG